MARTLAGDDNPDWAWVPQDYQHADCGGEIEFHEHERTGPVSPTGRPTGLNPRLALCVQCGVRWSRRFTGASHMGRNAWKLERAMNLTVVGPNGVTPWREWTLPEDELLVAMWPKHTAAEIAAHLNRDKASIQSRWNRLKKDMPERRRPVIEEQEETALVVAQPIPPRRELRRQWTEEEDAMLKRLQPDHTHAQIAMEIGRSKRAVDCRWQELERSNGHLPAAPRPAARIAPLADPNAPDPEIMALGAIYAALSPLKPSAQERVLGYLRDRLGLEAE